MALDKVDYARRSFAANRKTVEEDLADMRNYTRWLLKERHYGWNGDLLEKALHITLFRMFVYPWDKHLMVPRIRLARFKIRLYRKVEADLANGDLASAIEALSQFAPQDETNRQIARRVVSSPATIEAIRRAPHILRSNMLRLRDDLLNIQQSKTC